jgi:hypothetical protein
MISARRHPAALRLSKINRVISRAKALAITVIGIDPVTP